MRGPGFETYASLERVATISIRFPIRFPSGFLNLYSNDVESGVARSIPWSRSPSSPVRATPKELSIRVAIPVVVQRILKFTHRPR